LQLLAGTLLHTADLSNPCFSIEPAKEWEKRISHEFLFQSTLEVEHGLPVAPFMLKYDMLSRVVNQNHFMTGIAYPQWKTFVDVFPIMKMRLDQLVRFRPSAMQKVANRNGGVSAGKSLTRPVSRRGPISLSTSVARTHMYVRRESVGFVHR
jgi:hypothetical protein